MKKIAQIKVGKKDRPRYILAAQRALDESKQIEILARGEKYVGKALTIASALAEMELYEKAGIEYWREQVDDGNGKKRLVTCIKVMIKRA